MNEITDPWQAARYKACTRRLRGFHSYTGQAGSHPGHLDERGDTILCEQGMAWVYSDTEMKVLIANSMTINKLCRKLGDQTGYVDGDERVFILKNELAVDIIRQIKPIRHTAFNRLKVGGSLG